MAEITDKLLDHDYDGIEEYDNPLPRWWVWLFYLTIAWAVFYTPYYAMKMGNSPVQDYEEDMKAWNELHPQVELAGREEMLKIVQDPAKISAGKAIYSTRCMACHAPDGGGLVGPNLTDDSWLHGGNPDDIARVIYDGVPAKGMIAWKTQLSVDEIYAATAYVWSLYGSTPAKPKAPQGTKFKREP